MKPINYNRKFEIDPNLKEKYPYQILGEEMAKWFPKNQHGWMWSLFHKHSLPTIERAYNITKENGVRNIKYLVKVLRG